nr:hypothetical protein [Tanacetum cinerariifolium]
MAATAATQPAPPICRPYLGNAPAPPQPAHHYTATTFHTTPLTPPPPLPLYSNNRRHSPAILHRRCCTIIRGVCLAAPFKIRGVCLGGSHRQEGGCRTAARGLPYSSNNKGVCLEWSAAREGVPFGFRFTVHSSKEEGVFVWSATIEGCSFGCYCTTRVRLDLGQHQIRGVCFARQQPP